MVQTFFKRSCTIHSLRRGSLAGHIDLLAAKLATEGFSRAHSRIQLRLVGHFNRWLEQMHLTAEQLHEDVIERYRRWLKRRKRVRCEDVRTLTRLLDLLREQGIAPQLETESVPTARQILLEDYRRYLRDECGLSEGSVQSLLMYVNQFLGTKYPHDRFNFGALRARDILAIIRRHAMESSSVQAKHIGTALRNFFRYLRHRGEIAIDLAACVPVVRDYSFSTVPKFLPADAIEKILRRTDRSTPHGRRDHAILMLLARLGLRTCEIVRLELEDIDWEIGEITVRGKGGRWSKLPLAPRCGRIHRRLFAA